MMSPHEIQEIMEIINTVREAIPHISRNPYNVRHTVSELIELVDLADKEFGGVRGLINAVKESRLKKG